MMCFVKTCFFTMLFFGMLAKPLFSSEEIQTRVHCHKSMNSFAIKCGTDETRNLVVQILEVVLRHRKQCANMQCSSQKNLTKEEYSPLIEHCDEKKNCSISSWRHISKEDMTANVTSECNNPAYLIMYNCVEKKSETVPRTAAMTTTTASNISQQSPPSSTSEGGDTFTSIGIIVWLVAGGILAITILLGVIICCYICRHKVSKSDGNVSLPDKNVAAEINVHTYEQITVHGDHTNSLNEMEDTVKALVCNSDCSSSFPKDEMINNEIYGKVSNENEAEHAVDLVTNEVYETSQSPEAWFSPSIHENSYESIDL